MHPPPRQPKPNDFGRKITLNFGEDLFFFFFFLETTCVWVEKTFESTISAEKSLSISVKISEFLRFCAQNPPPPKFSRSATVRSLCNTTHSNERYVPITGYRRHNYTRTKYINSLGHYRPSPQNDSMMDDKAPKAVA